MSPVWRPVQDPPCLDRFCHLSHDAQRVMVAILDDFNSRKRELLQSLTTTETHGQNAKSYYQSIYEARFGPTSLNKQNQSSQLDERRFCPGDNATNTKHQSIPVGHQAKDNNYRYSGSNLERMSENSFQEEHQFSTAASYDSSRYSDSPPIETQGYRFLSQLTRSEAIQNQTLEDLQLNNGEKVKETLPQTDFDSHKDMSSVADRTISGSTDNLHDAVDGFSILSSINIADTHVTQTGTVERAINNFEDVALDNSVRTASSLEKNTASQRNEIEPYTFEMLNVRKSSELEVVKDFTSSQSLFSQDSLSSNKITPRRKRNSKHKMVSEKKTRSPSSTNFSHFQADQGKDKGHAASIQETTVRKLSSNSTNDYASAVINHDKLNKTKNIESFQCTKNAIELHTGTKGIEKSIDRMHLEENGVVNNKRMAGTVIYTPSTNSPVIESDECPFASSKSREEKVYGIFNLVSAKEKSMEPLQSGTCRVSREKDSMAKKRQSSTKGFTVPVKKVKNDSLETKETRKTLCPVTDVSTCSPDQQEQIMNKFLESSEVIVSLVYESGATQLRESLFAQEPKKRMGRKSQDKLRGIACASKYIPDSVVLFPFVQTDSTFYQITRKFLLDILKGGARKVGFHVQRTFLEVMKFIQWDTSKVDTSWTILDPVIALWLLDPDNPVNSFDEVLTATGMPQMSPSGSPLEMLYEDMMLLRVAMERLYQRLTKMELWDLFLCVEMKLTPLLAALELTALPVATHTLMQFSEILKKKCIKLEKEAHEAAGHAFLLTSPSQLRQVLFEELRLDAKLSSKSRLARTSVGKETSTSESVLTQLLPFHPLPGIILEYRQVQKLKSTYIDGILSCVENGYLKTNWDQTAAATGRLTAYQPNVQAIPKIPVTITRYKENYIVGRDSDESIDIYARDAFVSQTGWTLLAADFQQIELRLLAHLADDPVLLKLFNDKSVPDIFNALTAQWLGKSIEAVTTVDREQTKRVVYSIMYGVGKEKLAEHLKMSVEQAKAIMASFLAKFPAVRQFTQTCVDFCQKNGYCCSIFKRRRLIPNIRNPSPILRAQAERQAVNFCVQGSAADICKAAMIQVVHALSMRTELRARLLMQIHDELLLEVEDTDLDQVTALVKEVMESSEKLCGSAVKLNVPIPVSLSVGNRTWGHMNPVE